MPTAAVPPIRLSPPDPSIAISNPTFYRWLQDLVNTFNSVTGGIAPGQITSLSVQAQNSIDLINLGERSHQSLTNILAWGAGTGKVYNKHVSDFDFTTIYGELASLTAQIATINGEIAALTTQVGQNTSAITSLNSRLAQLTTRVSTLETNVSTLQGQVSALQSRSQVFNGVGAPGAGLGSNGDWYADTSGDHIYVKIAGTWTLIV